MHALAIWRRLDTQGHDAARLTGTGRGHRLQGTAVFNHPAGPACIRYSVEVDGSWRTRRGRVTGFVATRTLDHRIRREPEGWYLDDTLVPGLDHLWDLDYGFTPATNLLQLRRAALAPGQALDLPVAWFDADATTLTVLPQRYERRSETTYWYTAPSVPYAGLLEVSDSGFASAYPHLWDMEQQA